MPTLSEALTPLPYLQFAPRGRQEVLAAALSDFAGIVNESNQDPTLYRMSVGPDQASWNVMVPDPTSPRGWAYQRYSPDVSSHLASDPTLSPALQIYELTRRPEHYTFNHRLNRHVCMYYWCSPPQPDLIPEYTETRVEVGLLFPDSTPDSFSGIVLSNISPEWSPSDCAFWQEYFSQQLSSPSPEAIRNSPLLLHPPADQDPLTWFSALIGKPHLASQYHSGQLEQSQADTLSRIAQEASLFAVAVMQLYTAGRTDYQPQSLHSTLTSLSGGAISSSCLSQEAYSASSSSSESKFVHHCGNCGATIKARISKGYRCRRCDGVYEGC